MNKPILAALTGACISLLAGCASDPIVEVISVTPGLNDDAVRLAVLMAIADTGVPPGVKVGAPVDDRALAAVVNGVPVEKRHNVWTYESRDAEAIYAGYERHHGSLRIAIRVLPGQVTLETLEDKNVHHNRNVEAALQGLEARIDRAMKDVQRAAVAQGGQ